MFNNLKRIREVEQRVEKIYAEQRQFLDYAIRVLQSVEKNDKARFMYELRQEDIELIEDGKKMRHIRKLIS